MRQAEIVVDVIQGQLLAQAVLAFAEGGDASTDGGHMLADGEVHALNEAVLICQPQAASTCWTASSVPHTTRCRTRTRRRRRTVLTTCAYSSVGSGIQRGLGRGPVAWRRSGWTHWPSCVSSAVVYSLKPSVRKSGTQPGASTWTTWWTTRCAMARVRSPTSTVSSSLVTGSMAAQTQWGERDRRWMASASLTAPVFTALSSAKSSSSWTCVTRTSWRKYCEKAAA